jgi:hypothetical protein
MPGTLVITTLSDGTNSTSATNPIQGSAKAWVNFNGTTSPGTIRAQYNVSSVTKNGTGDYNINFTNAFADANYAPVAIGELNGGSMSICVNQGLTTSAWNLRVRDNAGGNIDSSITTAAIFR